MIALGAGVVQALAIADVVGLAIVGEGGVGDENYLHSSMMEGGVEVATVVVITTFDG